MKKRILALLLTFVMVLSLVPASIFAADTEDGGHDQEAVPTEAVKAAVKSEGTTVLAFSSDVHNKSGNVASNRLETWINKVESIHGSIDAFGFGGDMADASASASSFWTLTQASMTVIDNHTNITGVYTTGNHEYSPGSYSASSTNATQKAYKINKQGASGDNYIIYCLGSNSSSPSYANQVSSLETFLNGTGNDKPIFIITHFPLHYYSSYRRTTSASDVIDVLNSAVENGTPDDTSDDRKIVFLWGHNHTEVKANGSGDTNYDKIFAPGSTIKYDSSSSSTKTTKFFYAAAGCMSDSEYSNSTTSGSGAVNGKGLIVTINSKDQLSFTYYDEYGNDVTEGGTYTEQDPVSATSISFDETAQTVVVNKSIQLSYTLEPAGATSAGITWSSSNTNVATVTQSGMVTGVAEGKATITATLPDTGAKAERSASIEITVAPRGASTYYVLADALQADKTYLIVSAKTAGNAFAVTNNGSSSDGVAMGSTAVEIFSGDITGDGVADLYIDTDEESVIWEATANGSGFNLTNDGGYLEGVSGNVRVFNPQTYPNRYWTYSNEALEHKGGTYTYEVYYNNNSFTYRNYNSGSARNHIYIFEEYIPQGNDPVTGVTLSKSSLELGQGATEKLNATVAPATAGNKNVTWSSSNTAVATVSDTGVVTGVTPGTAVITVTTAEGGFTATCNVTVSEVVVTTYVQTDTLEAGYDYLIAYIYSGNLTNGNAYIVSTESGGSRILKGVDVSVSDGKIAVDQATEAKTVFTTYLESSSNTGSIRFKNSSLNQDLYTDNNTGLRLFTWDTAQNGKFWHYKADGKNLLWFFKDTSSSDGYTDTSQIYKYYLKCDESTGEFTDDHASTTSLANTSTPAIYLFVKKIAVTGVAVTPATANIAVGENATLTATVAPSDASIKTVTWSSSDTSVATVDANGKVTGVVAGTATITATTTDGGFTDSCVVTVSTISVTGITLDPSSLTIEIGKHKDLTHTISPDNATNKNVTWTSSNEAVATVEDGAVVGVAEGTAIITVTTEDGNKTATCSVTVIQPTVHAGYVIEIDGYALSTTIEPDTVYHPESSGTNKYYGLRGIKHEGDLIQNPTEDILWQITEVEGVENGYYIQSMDGRYLNATYQPDSPIEGRLNLNNTPDVWVLDGDLEDWILNGSYLKSTNASTDSKEICLAFETAGPNSSAITLFTIRSRGNADSSTVTSPDITSEVHYEETDGFSNNGEYLITVNKDATGNSVWAVKNVATTTSSTNTGSIQLDVEPANGSVPAYIITQDGGVAWKYTSSDQYLTNRSLYLSYSNSVPRASSSSGRAISYVDGNLRFSRSGGNYYYLTLTNATSGSFGIGSSDAASVRLFEKKAIVLYNIKFLGANGQVLYQDELAKGDMPEYFGATPVKDDDAEYTYTFIGWSPELETVKGLAIYTAQFQAVPKEGACTVTFLAEDGNTVIGTASVVAGTAWDEFEKPDAPAKTGYTFAGWTGAPATVTEDISVTASYTANLYTVTFVNEDGTQLQTSQVAYGQTPEYTGAAPAKAATADFRYEFAGWTPTITAVTGEATYTATYTEIARIYGQPVWSWTGNDADGYTSAKATFTTNDGAAEFTKEVTDSEIEVATTPAACEATGQKVYTASVTLNGSDFTDIKTVTIPALGHNWDYEHVSWNWEIVRSDTGYNVTASIPCTRCTKIDVREAEVTYDNGVYTARIYDEGVVVAEDTKEELPAEAYKIYVYPTQASASVGDTVTFTISVGPVDNFGSFEMVLVIPEGLSFETFEPANKADLGFDDIDFVKDTMYFNGFASAQNYSSGTETVLGTFDCTVTSSDVSELSVTIEDLTVGRIRPIGDCTNLYSIVSRPLTILGSYTVIFNANDGTAAPATATQTVTEGQTTALKENAFTRTGYTFSGWNTNADGSGDAYEDGQSVILTADLTLYAQWTANTFTVADIEGTFTYNGEAHTPAVTVTDGDKTLVLGTDYTVEYSNNVNAGTATVTVTGIGNYGAAGSVEKTFTIAKAAITASATGYSGSYDGNAHGITVSVTAPSSGYTVAYSTTQNGIYSETAPTYKNAGEYTVYYKVTAPNYEDAAGSAIIKIEKKEIGITWGVTTFTYDGQPHAPTATATGVVSGDIVTVTVNGAAIAVGTHTATAASLSNDNYKLPAANTTSFTITKGSQDAPAGIAATDETISGKKDGTITGLTEGMEYSADGQTWTTITADMLTDGTLTDVAPGTYQVRYAETENYNASEPVTVTVAASNVKLTVTFNTNGGSNVAAQQLDYNGKATKPADPAKDGHTFAGWFSNEALTAAYDFNAAVTESITLYAKWTVNTYTVTWKNWDGSVLETDTNVPYNTVPTYDGNVPAKASTVQYNYTFAGWTPEIGAITTDTVYTATFTESTRHYAIQWLNEDGTQFDVTSVPYGTVPTHEAPTKAPTAEYTYTFAGWDPTPVAVTVEATYRATFTAVPNTFSLSGTIESFKDSQGNEGAVSVALYAFSEDGVPAGAEAIANATVASDNKSYSFAEVPVGKYILRVTKLNHATRDYVVEIGSGSNVQNVKIHLLGDLNGDGKITAVDYGRVYRHAIHVNDLDQNPIYILTGYDLAIADINGNGEVTNVDAARMSAHIRRASLIW